MLQLQHKSWCLHNKSFWSMQCSLKHFLEVNFSCMNVLLKPSHNYSFVFGEALVKHPSPFWFVGAVDNSARYYSVAFL